MSSKVEEEVAEVGSRPLPSRVGRGRDGDTGRGRETGRGRDRGKEREMERQGEGAVVPLPLFLRLCEVMNN